MLKFFRKIRQGLLIRNKFNKYFLYAIGEIMLVVVGILIALQINVWNQNTKNRKEELRILAKLEQDLNNDMQQLKGHIANATGRQKQIDSIYLALGNPGKFTTQEFANWHLGILFENIFSCNSGTYDESLSAGTLKLIENDSLREKVFNYYRMSKGNFMDETTIRQVYDQILPAFFELFGASKEMMAIGGLEVAFSKDLDLADLSRNKKYPAMLAQKWASQSQQILAWKTFLKDAGSVHEIVQEELRKKKRNSQ